MPEKTSRRGFLKDFARGLVAVTAAVTIPKPAIAFLEPSLEDKIWNEGTKWVSVQTYEYAGYMTGRELEVLALKRMGIYDTMPKDKLEKYLSECNSDHKYYYFLSDKGSSRSADQIIQPNAEELRRYNDIISEIEKSKQHNFAKFVERAYNIFQNETGGTKNYDPDSGLGLTSNSQMYHPAVMLFRKEKGACAQKSYALSQFYNDLGIKSKMCGGVGIDTHVSESKFGHAWTRVYTGNKFYDLDPTFCDDFTVFRRIGQKE